MGYLLNMKPELFRLQHYATWRDDFQRFFRHT